MVLPSASLSKSSPPAGLDGDGAELAAAPSPPNGSPVPRHPWVPLRAGGSAPGDRAVSGFGHADALAWGWWLWGQCWGAESVGVL